MMAFCQKDRMKSIQESPCNVKFSIKSSHRLRGRVAWQARGIMTKAWACRLDVAAIAHSRDFTVAL